MNITTPAVHAKSIDASPAAAPDHELLRFILRYAVRAPSGHNTQPWRFHIVGDCLELHADRTRALPVVDPADRALHISCGAALRHVVVALRHFGFAGVAAVLPDRCDPDLLATVRLGPRRMPQPADRDLFEAIAKRHTHRSHFASRPVPDTVLARLRDDAEQAGAALHVVRDEARQQVAALVARGDRQQLADRAFRTELASWVRCNYTRQPDGIPGYAFGMPGLASLIGPLFMRTVDLGKRQAAKDERLARTAPALLLLTTADDTPQDWMAAGQAVGTVLLRATAAGLAASFLNQPIEVPALRAPLARLVAPEAGQPQLLLRIGYPTSSTRPTPRRLVADVLIDTPPRPDGAGPASGAS